MQDDRKMITETQVAVIIERLDHVIRRIDDIEAERLVPIETQTKVTNGRVTALEKWKSYILGSLAMATFIVSIVLPFVLFLFNRLFNN